ncbi:glycine zipper 2TM domain-containing protein [Solimonas sp. K1W22B-7]|uniref:glycine zipper 2TM domain-containing protein n=1 Tax=Solimonas sp. K1W22B-7 TaxID=2303331 RepID=UPI000E335E19|nr:glycine zipper 2TM domain-containing protein [Solimonas sp. K1W22B-7]AXQ27766.1 glycine zipper 2TM domain-containing protein [Solimonas sp. K1W22B-7]
MNNVTAGIVGVAAAAVVGMSAMVFATRSGEGDAAGKADKDKKEVVATREECHTERVVTNKEWGAKRVTGTILGGAAGGAIGHQIGGGSGKDVATVAGALGGAYAGGKVAQKHYPDQEVSYREKCRQVPVR